MCLHTCNDSRDSPANSIVESHGSIVDVSRFCLHTVNMKSFHEQPRKCRHKEVMEQNRNHRTQELHQSEKIRQNEPIRPEKKTITAYCTCKKTFVCYYIKRIFISIVFLMLLIKVFSTSDKSGKHCGFVVCTCSDLLRCGAQLGVVSSNQA